jgi:hypothetical protein
MSDQQLSPPSTEAFASLSQKLAQYRETLAAEEQHALDNLMMIALGFAEASQESDTQGFSWSNFTSTFTSSWNTMSNSGGYWKSVGNNLGDAFKSPFGWRPPTFGH